MEIQCGSLCSDHSERSGGFRHGLPFWLSICHSLRLRAEKEISERGFSVKHLCSFTGKITGGEIHTDLVKDRCT